MNESSNRQEAPESKKLSAKYYLQIIYKSIIFLKHHQNSNIHRRLQQINIQKAALKLHK